MPQARMTRVDRRKRFLQLRAVAAPIVIIALLVLALAPGIAWAQPPVVADGGDDALGIYNGGPTPVPAMGEIGTIALLAVFLVLLATVTVLSQRRARAGDTP